MISRQLPRPPRVLERAHIWDDPATQDLYPTTGGPPKRGRTSRCDRLVYMSIYIYYGLAPSPLIGKLSRP